MANGPGAAHVFLNRWRVAGINDFACTGNRHFQRLADRDLGVRRASRGNFGSFGLERRRFQSARASHVGNEFVNRAVDHNSCGAGGLNREAATGKLFRSQAGGAGQFRTRTGRARNQDVDVMRRPQISTRM